MGDSVHNQLVAEVAKDLLSQVAPQEMPLFRSISSSYFNNPEKALNDQKAKDELLGFGAAEAVTLITPVLLAVSSDVIKFLFAEAQKAMKSESTSLINDTVKSWFSGMRPKEEKKSPPRLTPEQLEQVRTIAIKKAQQLKLSKENTKLLADAIVGSLAVS
jgi:hypothetical protein